tara:strand:- start:47 stop:301 length:255 start_codon:yes stop_codon:yes gene_type:complete
MIEKLRPIIKILKPVPILTVIIILQAVIGVCKKKYTNNLEKRLHNQELYIEDVFMKTNYKKVDSLYLEIMDLGAQLDSMHLKYD